MSFSAAVTLAHAGARVTALVTEHERQQSYAAFRLGAALRWRRARLDVDGGDPGHRRRRAAGGGGRGDDAVGGQARTVECDWLVFTGDWIPDHVLARSAGLALDPGTRGPAVDTTLATSAPGVFAAGNLIHAAETADVAALSGRHAARQIAAFLAGRTAAESPVFQRRPLKGRPPRHPPPGTARAAGPGRRRPAAAVDLAERLASPPTGRAPPLGRFTSGPPSSGGWPGWRPAQDGGCWPGRARCG